MRVSVVVPLYNKAKYITRALDSIAAQTFGKFEVIVVDDGSSDESRALAEAYPDRRIRVIGQENAGPGAARNRGIAEAQGTYLAFLDADDEWMPEYLESNVRRLDELGLGVATVTSGYIECPSGVSAERMWRKRGIQDGLQNLPEPSQVLKLQYMNAYMWPCSTLARTEVVRRHGGFFDRHRCTYGEDSILWLKILLNERVYFELRPLAYFHREASGLSANYTCARDLEPFLNDPGEVLSVCPNEFRPLLRKFLAMRACKSAAMLGYWGDWRRAQALLQKFLSVSDWRLPYFTSAMAGCTPLAGLIGRCVRCFKDI